MVSKQKFDLWEISYLARFQDPLAPAVKRDQSRKKKARKMGRETLNKTDAPPPFVLCAQNISNKLCRQKFPLLGFGKNWMRSVEANWRIPNFQKVLAVGQLVQVSLVYDV